MKTYGQYILNNVMTETPIVCFECILFLLHTVCIGFNMAWQKNRKDKRFVKKPFTH